jgi:glycine dehydrogenase
LFSDINQVIAIFAEALGKEAFEVSEYVLENNYPMLLNRKSEFLKHEVLTNTTLKRVYALHQKIRT